ncbi:potassium/sodium hyperpolarization-activated cyclic nucleotide-gated channel 4-like [Erinaceus europaeus]|uniref:Potassium/sodium hyperpolarization-activated cyclic nucleotide-gated channel 4-like n=1 Tax=Erinaceus europaeus TaxID=9365 RepID=A0ABM3Y687_ERIEU|nr:potassium/sodium hyperpolarization-activated cyclic nucleotide-gated channel 4-like [Erinaceus europaeus]
MPRASPRPLREPPDDGDAAEAAAGPAFSWTPRPAAACGSGGGSSSDAESWEGRDAGSETAAGPCDCCGVRAVRAPATPRPVPRLPPRAPGAHRRRLQPEPPRTPPSPGPALASRRVAGSGGRSAPEIRHLRRKESNLILQNRKFATRESLFSSDNKSTSETAATQSKGNHHCAFLFALRYHFIFYLIKKGVINKTVG